MLQVQTSHHNYTILHLSRLFIFINVIILYERDGGGELGCVLAERGLRWRECVASSRTHTSRCEAIAWSYVCADVVRL